MVFQEAFADVPDPRDFNARHDLTDVLFCSVAAVLCGARSCSELAVFARSKLELLRGFVPLEGGAPSHDTFSRILRLVDPSAFNAAFGRFMAAFGAQARTPPVRGVVAVDGKSLRRAYDKGRQHMPPLMVSVFACETFMTLSQRVAATGGEGAAALEALRLLSLEGCTVTADALHCTRSMSEAVRKAGGHYVLAIKGNQSRLAADARAALDCSGWATPAETLEEAHGRTERRRAVVVPFTPRPGGRPLVGLVAVARLEAWREAGGTTTRKVRHYALSRLMPAREVLSVTRRHWRIENDLHWPLDVLFREDDARTRKDNGPANLAIIRRLALNIARAHPGKTSLNLKQQRAAWEDTFLIEMMTHMR